MTTTAARSRHMVIAAISVAFVMVRADGSIADIALAQMGVLVVDAKGKLFGWAGYERAFETQFGDLAHE